MVIVLVVPIVQKMVDIVVVDIVMNYIVFALDEFFVFIKGGEILN